MNKYPIPSWLQSWLIWRKEKTTPGEKLFNLIYEELAINKESLIEEDFNIDGKCPYCNDRSGLITFGDEIHYCICKVIEWQNSFMVDKQFLRPSIITKTSFDTITFPKSMPGPQQHQLTEAIRKSKRFIKNPDRWLLFTGSLGVGKTHLAKAIYSYFEPIAIYIASGEIENLVHKLRQLDSLGELYEVLTRIPILFIDDLGVEYGGPLVQSTLQKIIDARYERYLKYPLVVTTNKSPQEVLFQMGRAGDRLTDRARVSVIQINGISYRQLKTEERLNE